MHVNYNIWGWVGASNNDSAQGLHTLKSGPVLRARLLQELLSLREPNKTVCDQLPLTTLGQETRWAYSTTPPSPHGAQDGRPSQLTWVRRKLAATIYIHRRHSYYYSGRNLMEVGRLSRPRQCSEGAQPVRKAVYRSSQLMHNCPRRDLNLSLFTPHSDALTTRPLRPAYNFIFNFNRNYASILYSYRDIASHL